MILPTSSVVLTLTRFSVVLRNLELPKGEEGVESSMIVNKNHLRSEFPNGTHGLTNYPILSCNDHLEPPRHGSFTIHGNSPYTPRSPFRHFRLYLHRLLDLPPRTWPFASA